MKILFLGSADFGCPTLTRLVRSEHQVCGVVTTPPKPKGRGRKPANSPIEQHARELGITDIFTPLELDDSALRGSLSRFAADVFVVVAFRILPESLFGIPPLGTVNIHASLLPAYRGAAPIQRAVEAGETRTGITVFRIDKRVDTGKIILQRATAIGPKETTPDVYKRLAEVAPDVLMESLEMLSRSTANFVPQNDALASKAPKLRKEEAHIDWKAPALLLFNRIRAFKPFPGTCTDADGTRLGIEWAEPSSDPVEQAEPGTVIVVGRDHFDVACGSGSLRVWEVKPAGRHAMSVEAYLRGHRLREGMLLR